MLSGQGREGVLAALLSLRVAPEILCLFVVELLVCGLGFYVLLAPAGAVGLHWPSVHQATLLALTIALISFSVGLYAHETYRQMRRLVLGTVIGGVLSFIGVVAVAWVIGAEERRSLGGGLGDALALWLLALVGVRLAFASAMRAELFVRRIVVIGTDAEAERLIAAVRADHGGHVLVLAQLPPERVRPEALPRASVVLTPGAAAALDPRVRAALVARRLAVFDGPEFWEAVLRRIDVGKDGGWSGGRVGAHSLGGVTQRALDIALSFLLLAFTLPLMLVTAAAVRLDSKGPALYQQQRVGLNGRLFTVLKFRSMRVDAETRGPVWASKSDPRITRIGAFIRLVRIDELPQLINVLRGEMSFIGPRPERPHFTEQLENVLPHYRARLLVKPGLTGWAQVNYPYGASVEDARAKLSYDLYYVKHHTFFLDIQILFATIRVVLFQSGAR
jgi:exopolysaccharide biosynthesis polyprenyl glycosylphosphotransferase